jgi:lipid-A-disaccharide synthase
MSSSDPGPLARGPHSKSNGEKPLTICLVAAEQSGDRLGAALMRALRSQRHALNFIGVGGQDMLVEGLRPAVPIKDFAFIGWLDPIAHLPAIYRYIRAVAGAVVAARPDVLVIIDSPALTHQIARRVRKHAPAIPIVDYVSPSVWAWRPGRARAMRRYVDHLLALLPFEPAAHARLGGPPCSYVGHPLIEQIGDLRPNAHEAARRTADPPVLLVLPGSRSREIRLLMATFGEALARLRDRCGPFTAVLPTVPSLLERVRAASAGWPVKPQIVVEPTEKRAAFRIARAALAKSGTVTLELALAGVPMVAGYKGPLLDEMLARLLVSVPSIILPNLILGENVVPEFLQRDCTPQKLSAALEPLLDDSPQRRYQTAAFARLDEIMGIGRIEPSSLAADIVLDCATRAVTPVGARGAALSH